MFLRIGIVVLTVPEVLVTHRVTVNAVERQHNHHGKVGDEHQRVKGIPVVEAFECLISILRFEVVTPAGLRREKQSQSALERERAGLHSC